MRILVCVCVCLFVVGRHCRLVAQTLINELIDETALARCTVLIKG